MADFYSSRAWKRCRDLALATALERDGAIFCSHCGKEILNPYEAIAHHVKPVLDREGVPDETAYDLNNIKFLCAKCHNEIHGKGRKFFTGEKKVFLITGGKEEEREAFIAERAKDDAIIISVPRLHKAISPRTTRVKNLIIAFQLRDLLYGIIEKRVGRWPEAWVHGYFIREGEAEALAKRLGAERIDLGRDTKVR